MSKRAQYSKKYHIFLFEYSLLPGGTNRKESTCQCRRLKRLGFDPWIGKIPGGGHGNPLQYSCLENSMTEEPGGLESIASRSDKTEVPLHAKLRLAAGNRKDKA